jgi:hypothetical protein
MTGLSIQNKEHQRRTFLSSFGIDTYGIFRGTVSLIHAWLLTGILQARNRTWLVVNG